MADYKDIITGTLSSLVGKVKEVAESGSVRNIYEQGSNRAKAYGRIAKLTIEMNGDNEELRRVYTEIGKLYYEQAKDAPEGFFAPLFTQAEQITAQILAREDEINTLKASFDGSAEDARRAVVSARRAFDEGPWPRMGRVARAAAILENSLES